MKLYMFHNNHKRYLLLLRLLKWKKKEKIHQSRQVLKKHSGSSLKIPGTFVKL